MIFPIETQLVFPLAMRFIQIWTFDFDTAFEIDDHATQLIHSDFCFIEF